MREQKRREIVDCETQLVAVFAQFTPGLALFASTDTRIVDQHIEVRVTRLQSLCEVTNLRKLSKICEIGFQVRISCRFLDLLSGRFQSLSVTTMQKHGCTLSGQSKCGLFSESIG